MKNILIATTDLLLGEGIRELFSINNDLMKIYLATNPPIIDKEIEKFKPDVLIVDELLEPNKLCSLFQKFHHYADIDMLIVLNPDENDLQLYKKKKKSISGIEDLISIIQNSEYLFFLTFLIIISISFFFTQME